MSPKQWVFDPDSGGVKIKENIKCRTEERIIPSVMNLNRF